MLEYVAKVEGRTVSHVLARELEDFVSAQTDALSFSVPAFGEAMAWMHGVGVGR